MSAPARKTGQRGGAVITLAGVVVIWAAMRVVTWAPPFEPASIAEVLPLAGQSAEDTSQEITATPAPLVSDKADALATSPERVVPVVPDRLPRFVPERIVPPAARQSPEVPSGMMAGSGSRGFMGAQALINHVMLWQSGYSSSAEPAIVPPLYAESAMLANPGESPNASIAAAEMREMPAPSRWSMDAWVMWREDDPSPLLSGRPSYGRSQIGAVMRYRLAPASGHGPQLYARGSSALEGARERELALGASARPVPAVPVRLAAEARVSETEFGTEVRGAAFAVTEIPPVPLPAGFNGEVYAQAGYVSGEFDTPFVDGQARITRPIADVDTFRLEAGAAAWGGAQEDAGRLDIGPSASVSFRLGAARGRVSADYRFRIAGNAEPSSGPALTLSAGF